MYLYFLSKKMQGIDALWKNTKSKYKEKMAELIFSLEDYISTSGKANRDERMLTAILILESLSNLPFFTSESAPRSLKKDPRGKPCFDDKSIKMNIAHNEDFVLVAYDENAEIGVDLENEISPEKAEKLAKRFEGIFSLKTKKTKEKISAYEMKEDCIFTPITLIAADESFTAKWTAAEAIMKCDGGGFSTLPKLENLAKCIKVCTYVFKSDEKKIYVSLAKKD